MFLILSNILFILVIIYFASLLLYIIGNLKNGDRTKNQILNQISVIVAVKNGQKSLPHLLNNLLSQNYKGNVEFIIVDDQSVDNTKKIIKDFSLKNNKIKYVSSDQGDQRLSYKKKAIDAGIKQAKYNILLFTDVDCKLPNTWIKTMNENFHNDTDFLIGVAKTDTSNNIISCFQKIDLQMLFCVARGMTIMNFPFASIGQNQAYRKEIYNEIGFLDISDSIQGDDTLFLQLCLKNNIKVNFNDDRNSFVNSRTENDLIPFIKQRMRWAADLKVLWNYNKILFMVSLSTFITNFLILFFTFNIIFMIEQSFYFAAPKSPHFYVIIFMKLVLELILYKVGSINLSYNINIFNFLKWFLLEIPYVVFMGLGSFFIKYIGWKGQK
tara:strand:- start:212 stop:1357 length:1146 start_codon:yes stop_codon:yes gene_type:complete